MNALNKNTHRCRLTTAKGWGPFGPTLIDLYGLRWRVLERPVVQRKFFILHHKDRSLSAAAQAFVGHLRGWVQERGQPVF